MYTENKTDKKGADTVWSKVGKGIHIALLVSISVLVGLEIINLFLGYRFFPILLIVVLMIVYLLKELIRYTVNLYKSKKGQNVKKNTLKTILEENEIKTQEKTDKGIRMIDNGVAILKNLIKVIIIIVTVWVIFDSVDNMGKLQSIKDYGEIEGEIYECTNILGEGGACLIGNDSGWYTIYFKEDGSVLYAVEGNELMG